MSNGLFMWWATSNTLPMRLVLAVARLSYLLSDIDISRKNFIARANEPLSDKQFQRLPLPWKSRILSVLGLQKSQLNNVLYQTIDNYTFRPYTFRPCVLMFWWKEYKQKHAQTQNGLECTYKLGFN